MKAERLDLLQPCRVSCLSEEDFAAEMESTVRPFLKRIRRFRLLPLKASKAASPQGTNVSGNDSARFLSCELYPNPDAKATIVICYGFCESCRKYDELVYYFYRQGYEVAILDHRGHGKSVREVDDPSVVHIGRFTRYVRDFHHFVEKAVKPAAAGKPLLLYAHSMGGCIGALYLEQYPTDFSAAVLSAPMLGLKLGLCPSWAARALCEQAGTTPERLSAYVGPHVLAPDYEVSAELAARFAGEFGPSVVAGERNLDLSAALGATLLQAGVPAGSVAWCADSTASATGRFFSYRAEGGTCGRHGAIAVLGGSRAAWRPLEDGQGSGEERTR